MTAINPFEISFWLDTRNPRKKYDGAFTLYLQVYSATEKRQTYISTKKYLTPFTWGRIKKNLFKSGSNLTVEEKEIREFLLIIRQEAQKYNDPLRVKSLKQFENLFKKNTNSDLKSIFVYDIFDVVISMKEKKATKDSYKSAMASMKLYDKNKKLVIHDITTSWISGFRLWHQNQGSSKETANSYLRSLRHVFTHAEHSGVIIPSDNPFKGLHKISIPDPIRQTKKYNLTSEQIKLLARVKPTSYEQELAKDVFFFLFMFDGMRFSDMLVLEKDWIVNDELGERIDFSPTKTEGRSNRKGEVWITKPIKEIMNKYPGNGKYVFNFLDDRMNSDQITSYRSSKTSVINKNLKKLAEKIDGMPPISTKHARYSAASYVKMKTGASTQQISELMVNSPKMAQGYIDTPELKKAMQSVLSDVLNFSENETF